MEFIKCKNRKYDTKIQLYLLLIKPPCSYQKHLGIFRDIQLTFEEHLKVITTKVNKTIELLRILKKNLPRPALMTIYEALDYVDIINDEAYNE